MKIEEIDQIVVDICEENDTIICKLVVPAVSSYFPHRVLIGTKDIAALLSRKGLTYSSIITESKINNKSEDSNLRGTWVFSTKVPVKAESLIKVEKPSRKKPTAKSRSAKKVKTTKITKE
tara:strand:+ start:93 stop:452 length:360 start_codon:yes stop_codon:yes gene_type:complete